MPPGPGGATSGRSLRSAWPAAPVVLVGADLAALAAGMSLEGRPGVHLVGAELSLLALCDGERSAATGVPWMVRRD